MRRRRAATGVSVRAAVEAARGDDGYGSNLRGGARMRPGLVLSLKTSRRREARGPGLNEESPQRSHHESLAPMGRKDPAFLRLLVSYNA